MLIFALFPVRGIKVREDDIIAVKSKSPFGQFILAVLPFQFGIH